MCCGAYIHRTLRGIVNDPVLDTGRWLFVFIIYTYSSGLNIEMSSVTDRVISDVKYVAVHSQR